MIQSVTVTQEWALHQTNSADLMDSQNGYQSHKSGYDGGLCQEEIDECLAVNCGNGECVDLIGDFSCDCDLGYEGRYCEEQM